MNESRIQDSNSLHIGLNKDETVNFLKEGEYTHAINAIQYSSEGDMHSLSNEPSTIKCTSHPYQIIGSVKMEGTLSILFTTDDYNSEIGLFDETTCVYTKIVNSSCLNFKRSNLIKAAYRGNFECNRIVYWEDGINPSRFMNIDEVPYKFTSTLIDGCIQRTYTEELDCDALLLSPYLNVPYATLSQSGSGSVKNGSYRVGIAYSIDHVKVTDYLYITDSYSVFTKENVGISLKVEIFNLDSHFTEYQLVLISNINQQSTAEVLGYYNTSQNVVSISSSRDEERETIALSELKNSSAYYWRAEDLAVVNDMLLRYRVSTRPDLNYQAQANSIQTKYVAYKVPQDYYRKGGTKVGYMRDENYCFFIRWVDKTGHRSSWFHIPGREADAGENDPYASLDLFEARVYDDERVYKAFEVVNTADYVNIGNTTSAKEEIIGSARMGYYESTEHYPDNPVWDENACKPIRLHKMPDCEKVPLTTAGSMIILGVEFEKIEHPKDSDGNLITDYVMYEIGRASRKGNATIIAKGILHNAGIYKDPKNNNESILYRNYPQNDLRTDPFLSRTEVKGGTSQSGYAPFGTFRDDLFTFHSPLVQKRKINLGSELKIEGEVYGVSEGSFQEVYKHPKHKLIRDFSLFTASLVGVGAGLLAISGQKCTTQEGPQTFNPGNTGTTTSTPASAPSISTYYSTKSAREAAAEAIGTANMSTLVTGSSAASAATAASTPLGALPGAIGPKTTTSKCSSPLSSLPTPLRLANSVFLFAYYFGMGTEEALEVVKRIVPFQQYALQYNSHAFYDNYEATKEGDKRRFIENFVYAGSSSYQSFKGDNESFQINNTDRPTSLFLKTDLGLSRPVNADTSRILLSKTQGVEKVAKTTASGYYASVKSPNAAHYGQVDSVEVEGTGYITNVDITQAEQGLTYSSEVIFGGDTYIGRYTEKNIMPFFSQSLYDQKDGSELNYSKYSNIPYPRFWINTENYDLSEIIAIPPKLPNDKHSLDNNTGAGSKGTFVIKNGYFFLSCNGVMDFFCESEMNIDYRSEGDNLWEKYYDPYSLTNTSSLFRSDILNRDNYFLYDDTLSRDNQLNLTTGSIQAADFRESDCFTYYKNRVIYSLPQQKDLKKDNWRVFLANNYYDFGTNNGTLSAIKPINKTGALFLFEQGSPMMFNGVDTLRTDLGIKVTLGDGGLFSQPPQSITNSEYLLGASSSRWADLNTEFGLFFLSGTQGKVFNYSGQLEEISGYGLSSWFREHLPLKLLRSFPSYPYYDNHVVGVGYQMIFDNTYKILYVSKRDFVPKNGISYDNGFKDQYGASVELGNPSYFDDASWTISYNPSSKRWISFHDWRPEWVIQTQTHFLSSNAGYLWRHNEARDGFCKYYDEIWPFEVELPLINQQVTTLSSVEYNLESYVYTGDDAFHVLDWNFDEFVIWNSEQISGIRRMSPSNKKGPDLGFPYVSDQRIETKFTKSEQRFRINQFWDVTRDRGEYNDIQRTLWITSPDGYHREINPLAVDYNKKMIERKSFRHYWNKILLRRRDCEDKNMIFRWLVSKKLISLR